MSKIRRKSIENDFLLIFFYIQSEGAAQSSILMILRHPLFEVWILGTEQGRKGSAQEPGAPMDGVGKGAGNRAFRGRY